VKNADTDFVIGIIKVSVYPAKPPLLSDKASLDTVTQKWSL